MYKMVEYEDKEIQRIASNEMARGILRHLGIKKATPKIKVGKREMLRLKKVLEFHELNEGYCVNISGEDVEEAVARKLERMYEELLDTEYEYIFDEFGEYLIAAFIEYEAGHGYTPVTTASVWDEIYVRKYFKKEFGDKEKYWELTKSERNSLEKALCECVLYFASMGIDDDGISVIFMDTDYQFLDMPGGGNFLLEDVCGFVSAEDEREPVSGSLKEKL